jgi:hypothetical protein
MEGTEGSDHGHRGVFGCPFYIFRREPYSSWTTYLFEIQIFLKRYGNN